MPGLDMNVLDGYLFFRSKSFAFDNVTFQIYLWFQKHAFTFPPYWAIKTIKQTVSKQNDYIALQLISHLRLISGESSTLLQGSSSMKQNQTMLLSLQN